MTKTTTTKSDDEGRAYSALWHDETNLNPVANVSMSVTMTRQVFVIARCDFNAYKFANDRLYCRQTLGGKPVTVIQYML